MTAQSYEIPDRVTSYIDGRFVTPSAASTLPIINPATEQEISRLHEADQSEVDAAVDAAERAFRDRRWSSKTVPERQSVFARICELTRQHLPELAWLETANTGQPLGYTRDAQLPRVMRNFAFNSEVIAQSVEHSVSDRDAMLRYVLREPLGPVALISPSNAPTALASTKIATALAWGNTCVVKTSEQTPLALARFMEILTEAGVPDGVVNLVNGRGNVTGSSLVAHPLIRGISFTGGTGTAREIGKVAGAGLKRVDLELGGKSANLVMPSADLDAALDGSLLAIFRNAGQQCFAGSRILLHRDIADQFIERFVQRARNIRVGDPLDASTEIGPVSSEGAYKRVLSYVDVARVEGATILTGGRRVAGLDRGYFVEPTAVLATSNTARVCQEEIFGPFASIVVVDSIDEAIHVANSSRYGLVSYLWSNDLAEVMQATTQIQAGWCMVNSPMLGLDARLPFGGYKESGVGREGVAESRAFYTEQKTVSIAMATPTLTRLG